ncbi:UDP-N-acetylmuramoyl-tripeptide--D-alanyl-D-alanine ligase [Methylophaga sp. OBS3]|uniref:UDP-N-acetylmuramoyl-tripeptide--D-alanyl-D- alanine ligase n=1 Tax=Methylophaga sp. OBS3 TaxID=2991934 RepID=UPI0022579DBF|nr:UDP-N-acetylmuramoyl-tripeptide--D-alanyl-D-alanine ligase [Methylophaga sp. OBS3]MCX4190341.1 UDP-N-acetylmuramoyl-tripeptide--D-alanyl-D-alanine ligase [Methylophaga sp. OBS3]
MSLPLVLTDIAKLLGCDYQGAATAVTGTAIDSRKVKKGDIFIALTGSQVDGHDYLAQAREAGAVAALVSRKQDDELPQLVVEDVVSAFGKLATHWAEQSQAKIVAITGSNGKTTLKEMVSAMLAQQHHVIATQGNLNNELGVPLTLTRLKAEHQYAVIEMGANHLGEIARLVAMAKPQVAVINNVGAAHLEGFGSLDGVATEKGAIYGGLKADGVAVVNADMDYQAIWKPLIGERKTLTFGMQNSADVMALDCQTTPAGSSFMVELDGVNHFVTLPLPGAHNVANALAAITICHALGIDPAAMIKGLANIKPVPHRLQVRNTKQKAVLIDDTYNANPGSFGQALATLKSFPEQRWLVLGDFGELGPDSLQVHKQMGLDAKVAGVNRLFTVGEQSAQATTAFGENAEHYADRDALQAYLQNNLQAGVTCLIKGSRFMQLDKLADTLVSGGER